MASSLLGSGSPLGLKGPSLLPINLPEIESLDMKARYHSPRCGGDFFDGVALDSRVVFLLTDIAGNRPETHAIAVDVQHVFRTRAEELFKHSDANESEGIALLARDINHALIEAAHGVRLAPAFLGCYNLTLNILTYHYAGHLLAMFHDTEKTHVLEPSGIPFGLFSHSTYEPAVLGFGRHAKLLLVTKGVTESQREPTMFDAEPIRVLLESSTPDAASICEAVLGAADDSGDHPRSRVYGFFHPRNQKNSDDVTAVALVRRGDAAGSTEPAEQ
jgi:serine phosphatase RsbU (regulator of sigma subunit)